MMKRGVQAGIVLLLAAVASQICWAQAKPTATDIWAYRLPGFQLPRIEGSLNYAVSVSEQADLGYNGQQGAAYFTTVSGDMAYLSGSESHPFSALYTGGYSTSTTNQPSATFQTLALSQQVHSRFAELTITDSVKYLPETPSSGFGGIPGLGDLGLPPVQVGPDTGAGILTNYATRVSNTAVVSGSKSLTGKLELDASGSYGIERFVQTSTGQGLDTNNISGGAGLLRRVTPRLELGGNYTYARYSFINANFSFMSQGVNFMVTRRFTRAFEATASVGPQQTSSSDSTLSPSSLNFAADVRGKYSTRQSESSLGYTRSTNSGSGIALGARTDAIGAVVNRRLTEPLSVVFSAGYTRTKGLAAQAFLPLETRGFVGGAQLNQRFTRSLTGYVSYNAQKQTLAGSAFTGTNLAYNGLLQVFGVGLTYAPRSLHVGRQ